MIPVNILAVRYLANAPAVAVALGASKENPCLGLITTDCDDATYIALDAATKTAEVSVCFGRSFYGGAANASTPHAGEVIGVLAGPTPGAVRSGMDAVFNTLNQVGFEQAGNVPYLAYTVASCGSFLAAEANVPLGTALAYLIAPPLESIYALDGALKAADVKLCKLYEPPSPTNFGGALLSGTQAACQAACAAFAEAVAEIAARPIEG